MAPAKQLDISDFARGNSNYLHSYMFLVFATCVCVCNVKLVEGRREGGGNFCLKLFRRLGLGLNNNNNKASQHPDGKKTNN